MYIGTYKIQYFGLFPKLQFKARGKRGQDPMDVAKRKQNKMKNRKKSLIPKIQETFVIQVGTLEL